MFPSAPMGHTTTFLDLPDDVARLIFEAAFESDRNTVYLTLICRKIRHWIEPLIYRHVILDQASVSDLFFRTIQSSTKPKDFFARHVKSLLISYNTTAECTGPIIHACAGLDTLACWIGDEIPTVSSIVTSGLLHPRRLSIPGLLLPDHARNLTHPIFRNLTHLDIIWSDQDEWEWDALREIHTLKHLSLDVQFDVVHPSKLALDMLAFCPDDLIVLVTFWPYRSYFYDDQESYDEFRELALGNVDSRVVAGFMGDLGGSPLYDYVVCTRYQQLVNDWGHPSPECTNDFWARAKEIMHKRMQKNCEQIVFYLA